MSEAAKLTLTGKSKSSILDEIDVIKSWYKGKDYEIHVIYKEDQIYEMLSIVEKAIRANLSKFIKDNFTENKPSIHKNAFPDLKKGPIERYYPPLGLSIGDIIEIGINRFRVEAIKNKKIAIKQLSITKK